MILQVENNLDRLDSTLNSFFSTAGTTGGTVIPVKNINGFTAQWAIQIGRTGEEQSEILNIDNIGGTVLNTSGTLRFNHATDTPVYQIHYDNVIFLRSTTGTAGTAVALATVPITPDSLYTEYNDSSGVATYAYQSQYYNSVTGDISGTSGWFVPGGPSFYSLQKIRQRAKNALFDASFIKTDDVIDEWINGWIERETNRALQVNQSYSLGTTSYAFGTTGLVAITEPLFKYASKIEVTFDGITYAPTTEIPLHQFSSSDSFSSLYPRHYWQGDTVLGILPVGNGGTVRMSLGKIFTPLVDDTDELPQFLRGYTEGCIEYVLYKAFDKDLKGDYAKVHLVNFQNDEANFLEQITPRDMTGPKTIALTESVSGMNEDVGIMVEYYN